MILPCAIDNSLLIHQPSPVPFHFWVVGGQRCLWRLRLSCFGSTRKTNFLIHTHEQKEMSGSSQQGAGALRRLLPSSSLPTLRVESHVAKYRSIQATTQLFSRFFREKKTWANKMTIGESTPTKIGFSVPLLFDKHPENSCSGRHQMIPSQFIARLTFSVACRTSASPFHRLTR